LTDHDSAGCAPTRPLVELTYTFEPEKFENLEVPTMLLIGGDSPAAFRDASEFIYTVLPNCRKVILQGQQHIAMDTNTELFVDEVTKFLTE
jgi:pimeloyl-ACP methyl ester carboxylesterase